MNSANYHGSCLCGQVRYCVTELEAEIGHCHCTMCRKFHGAPFATYAGSKHADFTWLAGEEKLSDYVAPNGTTRRFCGECGSSLVFIPKGAKGRIVEFSLASLDTEINQRPDAHIYVANKANWYHITDPLPQHQAGRSTEGTKHE